MPKITKTWDFQDHWQVSPRLGCRSDSTGESLLTNFIQRQMRDPQGINSHLRSNERQSMMLHIFLSYLPFIFLQRQHRVTAPRWFSPSHASARLQWIFVVLAHRCCCTGSNLPTCRRESMSYDGDGPSWRGRSGWMPARRPRRPALAETTQCRDGVKWCRNKQINRPLQIKKMCDFSLYVYTRSLFCPVLTSSHPQRTMHNPGLVDVVHRVWADLEYLIVNNVLYPFFNLFLALPCLHCVKTVLTVFFYRRKSMDFDGDCGHVKIELYIR